MNCIHWQSIYKWYPTLKSRNYKPGIQLIKINPKSWEKHDWTYITCHVLNPNKS